MKPKRKSNHRFEILNAFVDFGIKDLSRSEIAVWLILYRDTKHDGTATTSQTDIARRGGLETRSVKRSFASLLKRGVVRLVRRGNPAKGASRYTVNPSVIIDPASESRGTPVSPIR